MEKKFFTAFFSIVNYFYVMVCVSELRHRLYLDISTHRRLDQHLVSVFVPVTAPTYLVCVPANVSVYLVSLWVLAAVRIYLV